MKLVSARASSPGIGTNDASRQTPRTTSVKTIRDFSSGILKQLLNVLMIEENISVSKPYLRLYYASHYAAAGAPCFPFTGTTSQAPPSFSILARADALNAWALTVNFRVNS